MTAIQICNSALMKIGANLIDSLTDGSKEANACTQRYIPSKRSVLRMHPWHCAIRRVVLSPLTSTPAFGYAYQFRVPADFVRVVIVNPETESDYKVEGQMILGDFTTLDLKYVSDVDESLIDDLIAEAIACYLAWDISFFITQSNTTKDVMNKDLKMIISKAKLANAQELPTQEVEANYFLEQRLGPVAANIAEKRNW